MKRTPTPPAEQGIAEARQQAQGKPGERLFLVTYEYTESGETERCGFVCAAKNIRAASEKFWNQHPGEWFHLISVRDGGIEAFWLPDEWTFVTIPD